MLGVPLEKFLHDDTAKLPVLVKAALAHVQFATIHPFLDGNGRVGRLLITFLLCTEGALHEPTLYLSLYLKQNRARYYELLQAVRTEGDWEAWLSFFLEGVEQTANQAASTARRLMALATKDALRVQELGRAANTALRVHQLLQAQPIVSIPVAAERLKLSFPAVSTALGHLVQLGLVRELTGKTRGRLFAYDAALKLLNEGMEPLK